MLEMYISSMFCKTFKKANKDIFALGLYLHLIEIACFFEHENIKTYVSVEK